MSSFFQVYAENWSDWWPQLVPAMWNTIALTAASYLLAVALGIVLALGKLSKIRVLRALCTGYIEFVRGIPALVILFLLYFGLVPLGIVFDPFTAAVIGLGMNQGGYMAEVFRGGIEALHKGQREAALAVGMTPFEAYRHIIIPQAVRIVLPPLLNMLINLLKDTSICSLIAAPELMLRAKDIAAMAFRPMHIYLLVGVIYFMMAWPLSLITRRVEAHMHRGRWSTV